MVEKLSSFNKKSLIAVLGIFLLTGFLATSIASYYVSKANIHRSLLERELPLASDNIYSEIQRLLLPPLNVSATMANSVFLRDWIINGEQDVDKITDYLNKIQLNQGMTSAFLASDKTLNYYSYKGLRNQIDPAGTDDWYARCKAGTRDFEMNADIDDHVSDQLTLFINYKVFDYDGRLIGITGVATRVESIDALIHRFKAIYHKRIYFVDLSGRVAFRDAGATDPLVKPNLATFLGSDVLAERLLSQPASALEYQRAGHEVLLNARFLPELQWYLVVEDEVGGRVQYLRRTLFMNLAVCLVITLLVLVIVYLTVQQYQKRLVLQNQTVSLQACELEANNQRLEQLHYQKDEFMKMVVHDLKTPIAGMTGLARIIPEETDPVRVLEYAEAIESEGLAMMDLIQSLLDIKAAESAIVPVFEWVDLPSVLEGERESWTRLAEAKSISLTIEIHEEKVLVPAVPAWMRPIFGNMVSNAVKYSPEGSSIVVKLVVGMESVRVWVTDQGPGIFPEERALLFRQFSRLSNRPTAGESSSGLGLYIVKTMAEKLGGSVGVESEPGKGSRFWVEFPLSEDKTV